MLLLQRLAARRAALDSEMTACVATADPSEPSVQATAARVWAEMEEVSGWGVCVLAAHNDELAELKRKRLRVRDRVDW